MPRLGQRPPLLAPVLAISGTLSAAILYIAFAYDRLPELWESFLIIMPVVNIVYTFYYLVRLVQWSRRSEALDGSDAWPETPIFPFNGEYTSFLPIAYGMAYFLCNSMKDLHSSSKHLSTLSGCQYKLEIIYRALMVAQLLFAGLVIRQARELRKAEDPVLCRKAGHGWQCKWCKWFPVPKHMTATNYHPTFTAQPLRTMLLSAVACASLSVMLPFQLSIPPEPSVVALSTWLLIIVLASHSIFLSITLCNQYGRADSAPRWPFTPHFTGMWMSMTYIVAMFYSFFAFLVILIAFAVDESVQWKTPSNLEVVFGILWSVETIVLLFGTVEAVYMPMVEWPAHCVQQGHEWECKRFCNTEYVASEEKTEVPRIQTP